MSDAYRQGDTTRRAVLGDAHVDRSKAKETSFNADFNEFITKYAWGDIWSRPGLDHHTRRLLTLSVLCAQGNDEELLMHARAALADGVTVDEIKEVLLHTALYAGLPRANQAFALIGTLLHDDDLG